MFIEEGQAIRNLQSAFSLSATEAQQALAEISQPVTRSAVVTEQDQALIAGVQAAMQECYIMWSAKKPGLNRQRAVEIIGRSFLFYARKHGDSSPGSLPAAKMFVIGRILRNELDKLL